MGLILVLYPPVPIIRCAGNWESLYADCPIRFWERWMKNISTYQTKIGRTAPPNESARMVSGRTTEAAIIAANNLPSGCTEWANIFCKKNP